MNWFTGTQRKRHERERLFAEQRGKCYYCGCVMLLAQVPNRMRQPDNLATLDHIVPVSVAGTKATAKGRCVVACRICNQERGTTDARLFLLRKQGFLDDPAPLGFDGERAA